MIIVAGRRPGGARLQLFRHCGVPDHQSAESGWTKGWALASVADTHDAIADGALRERQAMEASVIAIARALGLVGTGGTARARDGAIAWAAGERSRLFDE